jgi:hypothetical protein
MIQPIVAVSIVQGGSCLESSTPSRSMLLVAPSKHDGQVELDEQNKMLVLWKLK